MADRGDQQRIRRDEDEGKVKNPPDYAHKGGQKVKRLAEEGKELERERQQENEQHK
ncbi:MAG: hypothetical protein M1401_12115 [Chloroflexi bacterium]|nr:hypothetical protein [Chloroflexota bacterium]